MKTILFLMSPMLYGQPAPTPPVLGPYSVAINIPADIIGTPDTRPTTWGLAGSRTVPVLFRAPGGYKVHILRLESGSFIGWARGVYAPGQHVGVSWGITTNDPGGSERVPLGADNCFVWYQAALSNQELHQTFNVDVAPGGFLSDGIINVVLATFLDDQSGPKPFSIHLEATFIAIYQFEKQP